MSLAAFDPGFKGGLAIFLDKSTLRSEEYEYLTYTLPILELKNKKILDCQAISDILQTHNVNKVIIENVHAGPGQGVTSMFSFGKGLGQLIGMVQTLRLSYEMVSPQTWKKHFKLIGCDKKSSIARCKEIFPSIKLIQPGCRTAHEGIAEALLILQWGIYHGLYHGVYQGVNWGKLPG